MKSFCLAWLMMLGLVHAGSGYEVRCTDAQCGFKTEIGIGGGMKFEEASGYCTQCAKGVSVTWPRGEKPKPAPVRFWDALTGRLREIFRCKTCQQPFVKLESIEDLRHCPKCGKQTLKTKLTVMYD